MNIFGLLLKNRDTWDISAYFHVKKPEVPGDKKISREDLVKWGSG